MNENGVTIERKKLHKQVWSKPMSKLAMDYGISDVGLKKICKKLNVPTPPRGYWIPGEGRQNLESALLDGGKVVRKRVRKTHILAYKKKATPVSN